MFEDSEEEFEWLACHSREAAEQQIADYQEEEDASYLGDGAKLVYSLWKRRSSTGLWQAVAEDNSIGTNDGN